MSDLMIKVEELGKKYTISHEGVNSYPTLRDVIAGKANQLVTKTQNGKPAKEEFWALKDVSFEVKKGETLGVIGRNGAGKTTLLKILSRITEPTPGRVEISGRVASLLEVGTGFEGELTGRENIYLNGAILGMSRAEIKRKFDEIVDFSGVEKFLDTPVKRYSSGMYVRLAFAVAAHLEPDILIVDEVLAVGDAEFQKKCLGKMEEVSKGEGRTILFVSHNMGAINTLCSRALLLSNGSILEQGEVSACVQSYFTENIKTKGGLQYIAADPGDRPVYIKEVNLKGSEQFSENLFDVHTQLTLTIKIMIREPISGTTPYYDLKCNNEVVYRSFASDADDSILEGIRPGEYNFSSVIHSPLKKGKYSIDVRVIKITDLFYDEVNDAISFETDELKNDLLFKSYWHKRPGVVGFNNAWQVEQIN